MPFKTSLLALLALCSAFHLFALAAPAGADVVTARDTLDESSAFAPTWLRSGKRDAADAEAAAAVPRAVGGIVNSQGYVTIASTEESARPSNVIIRGVQYRVWAWLGDNNISFRLIPINEGPTTVTLGLNDHTANFMTPHTGTWHTGSQVTNSQALNGVPVNAGDALYFWWRAGT